jgi:S1-C subfamily serine protease
MLARMAFDDGLDDRPDDDRPAFREPPSPDDRLWRHPSEVRAAVPRARNNSWAIALCAGSVGALVATGVIAATGGLRRDVTIIGPTVPSTRAVPVSIQPPDDAVSLIAARVRPSIAKLSITNGAATTSGSGVMFRSDGHVLTNWHLVDGASLIRVMLASGKELPGRIVGSDRDTDIAIVKVEGGPYPAAQLGSTAGLKVGQRAIALGAPRDLTRDPSVTVGVVSALHQQVEFRGGVIPLLDMIQFDTTISPGSSGGALLDGGGAVIGITTANAKPKTLGFATPIDAARMVGDQLIANGRFIHVWLGIEGSDIEGGLAMQLGVDGGARVDKVMPNGPADHAGLLPRDVIVGVEDEPIVSMGSLVVSLRGRPPGDVVVLDVRRDLKPRVVRVGVIERPEPA